MKKYLLILLVAAMALTMVACGKATTSSESSLPDDAITGSTPIDQSTPIDTETPDSSASDGAPASSELPNQQVGTGGDSIRWTNHTYSDKLLSIGKTWSTYFKEKAGKSLSELWAEEWKTEAGAPFGIVEIVKELSVSKEKFAELNKQELDRLRDINSLTDEAISRNCFTDEEIDIIYSGDKKRIAEAFALPYAVVADNWELYPLRWIIDNPATLYEEREISLDAIQKAVDKIIEDGLVGKADKEALLARIEEYKKLL